MFRHKPPAAAAVRLLLIAPLMVSYLIIGVGLLIVFNSAGIGRSLFAVGIGHVVINLPLCYAIIYSQFGDHLCNIDNAAHDLGAGDLTTPASRDRAGDAAGDHRRVLPLIHPVWDEFIISLLLSRFDVTLPVMTFELMRAGLTPEVNAAGTIVFAISFAMALIAAMATIFRPGRSR